MDQHSLADVFEEWDARFDLDPGYKGSGSLWEAKAEYFRQLVKELNVCLLTQAQKDSLRSILAFVQEVKMGVPSMRLSAEAIEILVGTWFKRPEE